MRHRARSRSGAIEVMNDAQPPVPEHVALQLDAARRHAEAIPEDERWQHGGGLVCFIDAPHLPVSDAPHDDDGAVDAVYVLQNASAWMATECTAPVSGEGAHLLHGRAVLVGHGTLHMRGGKPALRWRGQDDWQVTVVGTHEELHMPHTGAPLGEQETMLEVLHRRMTQEHAPRRMLAHIPEGERAPLLARWEQVEREMRERITLRSIDTLQQREDTRALQAHAAALEVPAHTVQLQPWHMAGRKQALEVRRALAQGVRFKGEGRRDMRDERREREPVSVTLTLQQSAAHVADVVVPHTILESTYRGGELLREWRDTLQNPLLSGLEPHGQYGDMQLLALQAATDLLGARRITWLLALQAVMKQSSAVELDARGELPDSVRTQVMELTGCSPHTANARQKRQYCDFLHLARHIQLLVTPHRKRGARRGDLQEPIRVPLLLVTAIDDGDGTERPFAMQVNPMLTHHWMRVPVELLKLSDTDDPQGVARALGVSIITRQQLSLRDPEKRLQPERLSKVLERAGLLRWVRDCEGDAHLGRQYVKRELDKALRLLHELPSRRGDWLDLVGGCEIEHGHGQRWLSSSTITYRIPPWLDHALAQAKALHAPASGGAATRARTLPPR
jgi:hypothetical protein